MPNDAQVVQVLREARALIEDKKRWTTNTDARDRWSHFVEPDSPKAVRWCALGAMDKVGGEFSHRRFLYEAARDLYDSPVVSEINDFHGHAAVLQMFTRAIELAEKEQQ